MENMQNRGRNSKSVMSRLSGRSSVKPEDEEIRAQQLIETNVLGMRFRMNLPRVQAVCYSCHIKGIVLLIDPKGRMPTVQVVRRIRKHLYQALPTIILYCQRPPQSWPDFVQITGATSAHSNNSVSFIRDRFSNH